MRLQRLVVVALAGFVVFGEEARAEQVITCSSNDYRYERCEVDIHGGVRLERELSRGNLCRYRDSWGYDQDGIWVARGCRARFVVGDRDWRHPSSGDWGDRSSSTVRCESRNYRQGYCEADTRGGVRLVRQLSRETRGGRGACVYGRTWGFDRRGIWVDHGCRADFALDRGGWGDAPPRSEGTGTVRCESRDYRQNYCRAYTREGVRLEHQLSRAEGHGRGTCRYRRDWGYDRSGIWVRNGCRADFRVGGHAPGARDLIRFVRP